MLETTMKNWYDQLAEYWKEDGEKLKLYQTIKKLLKKRFQEQADAIMVLVEKIEDCDTLDEIFDMALEKSPEEIRETCLKACSSSS
jgi:arginyl-tRNA synthetase